MADLGEIYNHLVTCDTHDRRLRELYCILVGQIYHAKNELVEIHKIKRETTIMTDGGTPVPYTEYPTVEVGQEKSAS